MLNVLMNKSKLERGVVANKCNTIQEANGFDFKKHDVTLRGTSPAVPSSLDGCLFSM